MKYLSHKIKEWVVVAFFVPFLVLFVLLILLTVPFFLIYSHFSDKQFQKRYNLFLERMNGAHFFCYNSRKSSVEFARATIVPELDPSVKVVFVDGRSVLSGEDSEYISRMLYNIKERKGFPYLLKIENGQVVELSVNNQFYSILVGRKPITPLLDRIDSFFNAVALAK